MILNTSLRKKDQIYDLIMTGLYGGKYKFGQKIFVKELTEETGISRQPIMAALSALSSAGFVRIIAQVGCEVISPTVEEVSDFFLMFSRLEGLMAELAAKRGSEVDFRRLAILNKEIAAIDPNDNNLDLYRELNLAFHRQIHQMTYSEILTRRQSDIFSMADFLMAETIGFMGHAPQAADEHEVVVEALRNRNATAARDAIEEHILAVKDAVIAKLKQSA